jgi:hypothetical protein
MNDFSKKRLVKMLVPGVKYASLLRHMLFISYFFAAVDLCYKSSEVRRISKNAFGTMDAL